MNILRIGTHDKEEKALNVSAVEIRVRGKQMIAKIAAAEDRVPPTKNLEEPVGADGRCRALLSGSG